MEPLRFTTQFLDDLSTVAAGIQEPRAKIDAVLAFKKFLEEAEYGQRSDFYPFGQGWKIALEMRGAEYKIVVKHTNLFKGEKSYAARGMNNHFSGNLERMIKGSNLIDDAVEAIRIFEMGIKNITREVEQKQQHCFETARQTSADVCAKEKS